MMSFAITKNPYEPHKHEERLSLFYIIIWLLYLLLSPVYMFPKGYPQPADMILIFGILPALGLMFLRYKGQVQNIYFYGLIFALFTFVINWVNYAFYPHYRFPLASIYYIYNFLVFAYVVYLFKKDPDTIRKASYWAIVLATICQFIWAVMFPDQGYHRVTAGFINPNQLAYWALLTSIMLVMMKGRERLNILDLVLFCMLGYMQIVSLSKAGIICFLMLLCVVVFTPNVSRLARALVFLGTFILLVFGLFEMHTISDVFNKLELLETAYDRLAEIGEERDDSAEGRGYLRITNYPEYVFFGAGEGAFSRFGEPRELHSGIATLLFSYGIVGTLIFSAFIFIVFRSLPWYFWAFIIIVMLYGVTHQNIRFTHFWVFLGMAYSATFYLGLKPKQGRRIQTIMRYDKLLVE